VKTLPRIIFQTLSAGAFLSLLVSTASAGCGDVSNLYAPFRMADAATLRMLSPDAAGAKSQLQGFSNQSLVGMWKIQFISEGNTAHNPSIPNGAVIDFGYSQIHSDGTEILNSGAHSPATQNFCLGVWGQSGFFAFQLNHFALSYNASTQALQNYVQIREQLTLSDSGDSFTGTFTIDIYDTNFVHVDHLAGNITATRVTLDTGVN
jgi:hypothetical protein